MKLLFVIGLAATLATIYFVISDRTRMMKRLDTVEKSAAEQAEKEATPSVAIPVQTSQPIIQLAPAVSAAAVASAEAPSFPAASTEGEPDPEAFKAQASAELEQFFEHLTKSSTTRIVQSDLQEAFGKLQLPNAPNPDLDCRGSVCRAEFARMDDALAHELLMRMTTIGWTGPMTAFITDGPGGAKSVRVFVASRGAQMPLPHG